MIQNKQLTHYSNKETMQQTKETIQQNKNINKTNAVSHSTVQEHPHTDEMAY